MVDSESQKNEVQSKTAKISELEAALKKEQDTVRDLEQRLNEVKVVENGRTWKLHTLSKTCTSDEYI